MNSQIKIYFSLFTGFSFLLLSLFLSYNSITKNSHMLKHLQRDSIKLSYYAHKIDENIKLNQIHILQILLFENVSFAQDEPQFFQDIKKSIFKLEHFIPQHQNEISNEFISQLKEIKAFIKPYKSLNYSIVNKKHSINKEQMLKLLIKFNTETSQFSKKVSFLIELTNAQAYGNVLLLEENNHKSTKILLFSFFIATLTIIFSLVKFISLQKDLTKQLSRAQKAENDLLDVQERLLEYNENLETEVNKKTKELHLKIYTHFLSGLPNRNRLLEDANTYKFSQMAILNIDKFQSFNDIYGEEVGNVALQLTAEFLQTQIEEPELYLYHISGDEFVIVCRDSQIVSHRSFIEKVEHILKNYAAEIFTYDQDKFSFRMSAGVAFTGKKKMLAYADMALKDAKKRNIHISIFSEDKGLEQVHKDDIKTHKILIEALETNNVISYFQPIKNIQDTSKEMKYESLVRIDHHGKIIPPFHFLDVAKANRIYYKVSAVVIKNTLHVISKYQIPCSLNLSLMDINDSHTMKEFFDRIEHYDYNELLTVELLETEEFKNYEIVYDFCTKVRSFGIKIALDDFGSGYSNFSHILNLPVNYIKIDASLISHIDRDYNARIMVETIVALAKKLKVETIAEFVSSKEILDVITEIGVDYAQGYHIGKPEPIEKHLQL